MSGFRIINRKPEIERSTPSRLDYGIDWTDWLDPADQIVGAVCVATGVTAEPAQIDGAVTFAFVDGVQTQDRATLAFTVTTLQGRTDTRTLVLRQAVR